MGLDPNTIPEAVRKLMPPEDRAKIFGDVAGTFADKTNTFAELKTDLVFQKSTNEEKLNKLEKDWLRQLRLLHPPERIGIQSITLKLANDTRYTPDFWTIDANGQLVFWETKGFMRDDARVKIHVAARQFLWARFVLVHRRKGQWFENPIKP